MLPFTSVIVIISLIAPISVIANPHSTNQRSFRYEGELPPIKNEDEPASSGSSTMKPEDLAAAEAACWDLIQSESVVTFALQSKVLDKLVQDVANLTMDEIIRETIVSTSKNMRLNMDNAKNALTKNDAIGFFDDLFESTEDILKLSRLLLDPRIGGEAGLLANAVMQLGRNNGALIQEFNHMCSFMQRSPRPRSFW